MQKICITFLTCTLSLLSISPIWSASLGHNDSTQQKKIPPTHRANTIEIIEKNFVNSSNPTTFGQNDVKKQWFSVIKSGKIDQMIKLYQSYGESILSWIDTRDPDKADALVWACYKGHYDVVKQLLEWGADCNKRYGSEKNTVIDYARKNNYNDVVNLLLAWEKTSNPKTSQNAKIPHHIDQKVEKKVNDVAFDTVSTPSQHSSYSGTQGQQLKFHYPSKDLKMQVNTLKEQLATSQAMCQSYQKEINRQTNLLKDKVFGANLAVYRAMPEDEIRKLWLEHAKTCNFDKLKAIQGARGKIPIKYTDKHNRTALHYAVIKGHLILLKNLGDDLMPPSKDDEGCNIDLFRIPDSSGCTVLDIAIEEKDYRAVDYIYEICKHHKVNYKGYLCKYTKINLENLIGYVDKQLHLLIQTQKKKQALALYFQDNNETNKTLPVCRIL